MLLAWMDKRIVFMLSTKYSNNMVDIQTRLVVLLMFVYVVIIFILEVVKSSEETRSCCRIQLVYVRC